MFLEVFFILELITANAANVQPGRSIHIGIGQVNGVNLAGSRRHTRVQHTFVHLHFIHTIQQQFDVFACFVNLTRCTVSAQHITARKTDKPWLEIFTTLQNNLQWNLWNRWVFMWRTPGDTDIWESIPSRIYACAKSMAYHDVWIDPRIFSSPPLFASENSPLLTQSKWHRISAHKFAIEFHSPFELAFVPSFLRYMGTWWALDNLEYGALWCPANPVDLFVFNFFFVMLKIGNHLTNNRR